MESETRPPYASQRRSEFFARLEQDREANKKTNEMVKAIHTALIGDGLGNPGLVTRVKDLETAVATKASAADLKVVSEKTETHDRKIWLAASIPSLLAAAIAIKAFFFPSK